MKEPTKKDLEDIANEDIEISESEFVIYLTDAVNSLQKQIKNYQAKQMEIIGMSKQVSMYKDLGYNVKFFYNNKDKQYFFEFKEKEKVGFRK